MLKLPKIILASGSPRRAEILTSTGWAFERDVPDVDETRLGGEPAGEYVMRLARAKAETIAARHPGEIVLGADTIVVINGEILGKPVDESDARDMLAKLSASRHVVLTGIAVVNGTTKTAIQQTGVTFAEMNDDEIEFLVRMGDPLDKAGAYAVQAQAALFIEGIQGDYWNVVGLPINLVYKMITDNGESVFEAG